MFKTRFISMLVLLMTAVTGAWATITVTWNDDDITGTGTVKNGSFTKDGVTITAGFIYFDEKNFTNGGTFTTTLGNFTKIEVTTEDVEDVSGTGWSGSDTKKTWTGNASSVSFSGDIWGDGMGKTKFVFTIEPATVAVTGVTLAPTSATLTLGETETVTLIPTVLPAEATDKSVTWSSSNEAVATVTDGVVTAVAAGEATITVTTTDGAFTATCTVTVADPTYTVTLKEGTEDATSWTFAPAEATTTGVAAGTTVTATYGGVKKVKSVKAVKKAASLIVNPVVGQIIGSDGKNYDANATLPDGVTAVAMIAYVGSETGVAGYTHGLALALTDEASYMNWSTATGASGAAAHTPDAPTPTTSSWMLPSKDQWDKMITAAGSYTALRNGFSSVGGSNLSLSYWSSTEYEGNSSNAWYFFFYEGYDRCDNADKGTDARVRACLAF